jgi:hypothetical protein
VADFVGAPLVVDVALDSWAAAVFSGRSGSPSRLKRSPLWRSLCELSGTVSAGLRTAREELSASADVQSAGRSMAASNG